MITNEDLERILYTVLSIRDEIEIQNDLYNVDKVDELLAKMETYLLETLEGIKE